MATQQAMFAAQGISGHPAFAAGQGNIRNYNADEQARKLSLSFRKHQSETAQRLRQINLYASKDKRTMDIIGKSLNLMNFNGLGGSGASLNG